MNAKSVTVQGALAGLGLAAAYLTWQREPAMVAGEVLAFDTSRNDLEKVRFSDERSQSWVELSRGKDDNGPFVWVRLSGTDASNVVFPSGHPMVAIKVPERLVRGNESASRVFDSFAPLRASRGLGVLDAALLKNVGLDAPKKHIDVAARGNKRRFAIVPAPPGGNDPYLRDDQDGRVYLVGRRLLTDLDSASTNLVDRRLHVIAIEDLDRVVITFAGKPREFAAARVSTEEPGIRLSPKETPDKPDATVKNWHDRVWALFPSEVLGKDEVPPPTAPEVVLRADYFSRGRKIGWVELAKAGAPPVSQSGADAQMASNDLFARSEFSAGWMKLPSNARELLSEGETILSRK